MKPSQTLCKFGGLKKFDCPILESTFRWIFKTLEKLTNHFEIIFLFFHLNFSDFFWIFSWKRRNPLRKKNRFFMKTFFIQYIIFFLFLKLLFCYLEYSKKIYKNVNKEKSNWSITKNKTQINEKCYINEKKLWGITKKWIIHFIFLFLQI